MTAQHDIRVVPSGSEHLPFGWRCTCGRGERSMSRTRSIALSSGLRHARAAVRRGWRSDQSRRIVVDFAEPTLRAIQEALFEQIASNEISGELLNSTIEAERMVSRALGDPTDTDWNHIIDDRWRS